MYRDYNKPEEKYSPFVKITMAIITAGLLLSLPILYLTEHKEFSSITTGTVVEKTETNKASTFFIDTDGNKDTIEKIITLKKLNRNAIYTENMKEGSQIKFMNTTGKRTKLDLSTIYQIDDFIVRKR